VELITNTFVLIAPDCPASSGIVPMPRGAVPTVPFLQYQILSARPYSLTQEDLMLEVYVRREGLTPEEAEARAAEIHALLFGKPYPCMRASALPKRYGWGVHHDVAGRIALFGVESPEYRRFAGGAGGVEVVTAMRSKRPS
jgi:hypothetical protein